MGALHCVSGFVVLHKKTLSRRSGSFCDIMRSAVIQSPKALEDALDLRGCLVSSGV